MLKVIESNTINQDFGIPEGTCADCGELTLFAKDIFGDSAWTHKFELNLDPTIIWFEPRCPIA